VADVTPRRGTADDDYVIVDLVAPEHICEVRSGGKDYVIRGEPRLGVSIAPTWASGAPLEGWAGLPSALWRSIRALKTILSERRLPNRGGPETGWIVQVRARSDDPFGKVLYEEDAADFPEARDRAEALARELRRGTRPWEQPEPARKGE
jgi:hypothetical protein